MRCLTEEELVRSIVEQTERSAAVIGQTDLSRKEFDPTPVIVSSLTNIFDSALTVLALEDAANDRDECYRSAAKLVMSSPAVSAEQKGFIRSINSFRSDMSLDSESSGVFDSRRCLDFLNSYDCFMFQFFKKSRTVIRMQSDGTLGNDFVSFRNILEKLIKKELLSTKTASGSPENEVLLRRALELIEKLSEDNLTLNKKIDELNAKLDWLITAGKSDINE